ncbi:MAG: hypothetical protein JJU18_08360 [Oceanicaulis sp.]|nr:hypothetical protein [Oceanicaulis sp.]
MRGQADVIIIGAGMAGLALARALAGPGLSPSLLVLEPRALKPDPRLWIFPAAPGHALARFAWCETRAVRYAGRDGWLNANPVWTVPAGDVQAAALEALASGPRTRLETGVRIDGVRAVPGGAQLEGSLGVLNARQIIDARPAPDHAVPSGAFAQIILSSEAQAGGAAPGFELSAPVAHRGGLTLFQRLVLPGGRMLAEAVRYAPPGDAGEGLEAYFLEHLPDGASAPPRRAVLPLAARAERRSAGGPVIAAPARAGGLRFAVGMEALRLAQWAEDSAHRWAQGRLIAPPPDPGAQARAPALELLKRLRHDPGAAADWLTHTLNGQDPDAVTAFLADAARAGRSRHSTSRANLRKSP